MPPSSSLVQRQKPIDVPVGLGEIERLVERAGHFVVLADLEVGRVSAFRASPGHQARDNAAAKADSSLAVVIQPASAGGVKENNCLIAPKSSKLGPVLQMAMQKLISDGTYAKILRKWGIDKLAIPTSQINPTVPGS